MSGSLATIGLWSNAHSSGLVSGRVEVLDNPLNGSSDKSLLTKPWPKYEIGKFHSPVAICCADITGNGLMDVVVCHSYGTLFDLSKSRHQLTTQAISC